MLKSNLIKSIGMMAIAAMILVAGCSDDEPEKSKPLGQKVLDDTVESIAEGVVNQAFAETEAPLPVEEAEVIEQPEVDFNEVNDLLLHDSLLYVAYDEGLAIYDFTAEKTTLLKNNERYNALAFYDGELYAGGDALYTVRGLELFPAEVELQGVVTSLYSDSFRLLIGTSEGLFSKSPFGEESLMEGMAVNDLQFDNDGLWVATAGYGLYRWDGETFKRRYLLRDTTIFDTVYDLDFNHEHLFIAAATGFFVYDGGKWEHWTAADGIPSDCVKAVNADDWMVKVGTDQGMIAWFDHNLYPVKKLENVQAEVIDLLDEKLIVGTRQGEVLMKSGEFVTTLIEQDEKPETETPETLTMADELSPDDQQ